MSERQRDERQKPPVKDARAQRLAAALKSNLKRRKAQARSRDEAGAEPPPPDEDNKG